MNINFNTVDVLLLITLAICRCPCKHGRANYRTASATALGVLDPKLVGTFGKQVLLRFGCDCYLYHNFLTSLRKSIFDIESLVLLLTNSSILHKMFAVNKIRQGNLPGQIFICNTQKPSQLFWKKKEKGFLRRTSS